MSLRDRIEAHIRQMAPHHREREAGKLLIAAAAALRAQGWMPIETAPKDGTTILIGRDMGDFGFIRGYGYFEGIEDSFVSGWISHGFNDVHGNLGLAHPTVWMPLPAAPNSRGEDHGR